MTCDQAHELLWAALDHETSEGEMAELEAHLRDCLACRSMRERFAEEDRELRLAFAPHRSSAQEVTDRVLAQLPDLRPIRRRPLIWPMLLSAAAGFLVAMLLFRPWEKRIEQVPIEVPVREIVTIPQPEKPPGVQLAVAKAPIQYQAPGENLWQTLAVGASAPVGCRLKTSPDLRCELNAPDGSVIRLNGGTEVVFTALRKWDLVRGQIMARVAKAQEKFQVQLADLTVTALGTEFDILAQPADVLLSVLEGSTRLDSRAGAYTVASGEQARFINGTLAEKNPIERNSLLVTTRWVNEILMLKGTDNKELAKRVDDLLAQLGQLKGEYLGEEEIRSLGDRCVLPLSRYLQSERSRGPDQMHKRAVTSRILADMAQPWSIPDLIQLLNAEDGEVRFQAARGLLRLTQQSQGLNPDDWRRRPNQQLDQARGRWQAWWEDNKHRYPGAP